MFNHIFADEYFKRLTAQMDRPTKDEAQIGGSFTHYRSPTGQERWAPVRSDMYFERHVNLDTDILARLPVGQAA